MASKKRKSDKSKSGKEKKGTKIPVNIEKETETEILVEEELKQKEAAEQEESAELEETEQEEEPEQSPEEKVAELEDRLVRKVAEFENFKKRKDKEFIHLIETANEGLMLKLLPILDDLDRTLEHDEKTLTIDSLLEGIQLIQTNFKKALQDAGLQEMEALGEEFDAELHEALMQMEGDEEDEDKVVQVYSKGYLLNEKVIRHAKVVVGK